MAWWNNIFKKRALNSTAMIIPPPTAAFSPRNYDGFANEGYQKNVIAFRSIEWITDALSQIHLNLKKKTRGQTSDQDVFDHEVLTILENPNPIQTYQTFVKSTFGYFLISGNAYMQAVGPGKKSPPKELYSLCPKFMTVKPGFFAIPSGFTYRETQEKEFNFMVDVITGDSPIRHLKTFHPLNKWYGLSFIEAASFSVDQHNQAAKWNLALLQNSARPSGALVMAVDDKNPTGSLTEEQKRFMRQEIEEKYVGAANSGRPLLLEGGLDWKEMGFNPKDMDWLEGQNTSARDIAKAFGVPPQLLGIPGDNTYSNYSEARLALYEDTVMPILRFWVDHLNNWLVRAFDQSGKLYLEPDFKSCSAFAPLFEKKWAQAKEASDCLTVNERRELMGFGKYDATLTDPADKIYVTSSLIPLEMAASAADLQSDPNADPNDPNAADDFEDPAEPDPAEDPSKDPATDKQPAPETGKAIGIINGKAINLRTRNAKEKYRQDIIRRRKRLELAFASALRAFWKQESSLMQHAVRDIKTQNMVEFAVDSVLDKTKSQFKELFKRHVRHIWDFFAKEILALAKSYQEFETKDAETYFESFLQEYIEEYSGNKITRLQGTTKKRVIKRLRRILSESLEEGATPDSMITEVKDIYSEFSVGRAATIVRTEVGIAQNEAQREAAKALKIPGLKKTWVSDQRDTARGLGLNDSTNHISMDGVSVDLHDKFRVPSEDGEDDMEGPGDPDAPADQVINCACVCVFEKGETENE